MKDENENRLIEMQLHRLDMIAAAAEAKYGIGNLLEWMPSDFKEKWQRQNERLAKAVDDENYASVMQLVDGCIRAWGMMEDNAVRLGKGQAAVEWLEHKLPCGFTLRVAKNMSEARRIAENDVVVWSLDEVARVIKSEYTLVNQVKDTFPDAQISKISPAEAFDFKKGDEVLQPSSIRPD